MTPADDDVPRRRWARWVGAWLLLAGFGIFLDGLAGGVVAVVVGAVLLARLPTRLIGGLGVLALLAAPIVVALDGLPTSATVSPAFVSRSLLPHHLVFGGLLLVSVWAIVDLAPLLARGPVAPLAVAPDRDDRRPLLGWPLSIGLLALVAAGALLACRAVLGS